jgi:hypothetical protein
MGLSIIQKWPLVEARWLEGVCTILAPRNSVERVKEHHSADLFMALIPQNRQRR